MNITADKYQLEIIKENQLNIHSKNKNKFNLSDQTESSVHHKLTYHSNNATPISGLEIYQLSQENRKIEKIITYNKKKQILMMFQNILIQIKSRQHLRKIIYL